MSSGVEVPDTLIQTLKDMKLKKLDKPYSWMTIVFKPDTTNPKTLDIGSKGTDDYEGFKKHLLSVAEGCFAVVDVPLSTGGTKLVLMSWAPDTLGPKPKMMVASTYGALKAKVEGADQYQASDASDLDIETVRSKVDRKK